MERQFFFDPQITLRVVIPKCDVTDRMGTVEMGNVLSDVHRRAKIACERLIAGDKAERPLNRPLHTRAAPARPLLSRGRVSLQFLRF